MRCVDCPYTVYDCWHPAEGCEGEDRAIASSHPPSGSPAHGCPCRSTIDVMCEIPAAYSHTGKRREKTCGIDKCLAPIVSALQAAGVGTVGCCCGHGRGTGEIIMENGTRLLVEWPWRREQVPAAPENAGSEGLT